MQGKSLALVLDRFNEVMPGGQQGMNPGQTPRFIPLDTGLEKLLAHYGIRIQQSFVLDENCFRQQMPAQFGGGDQPIYYAPLIKNRFINKDLDFMKNIKVLVAKNCPLRSIFERSIPDGFSAVFDSDSFSVFSSLSVFFSSTSFTGKGLPAK